MRQRIRSSCRTHWPYNAAAAPEATARIGAALGTEDPARKLFDLARDLGAPTSLAALGMPQAGIDQAADFAVETPYWNPRPVTQTDVRALIARAWAGLPPESAIP
jgi:maleylacetate reductase